MVAFIYGPDQVLAEPYAVHPGFRYRVTEDRQKAYFYMLHKWDGTTEDPLFTRMAELEVYLTEYDLDQMTLDAMKN